MRLVAVSLELGAIPLIILGTRGVRRWDALGVQFVIIAAVYHGLTELVQTLFTEANFYRDIIHEEDLNRWIWIAAGSLLAFSAGYVASSRLGRPPTPRRAERELRSLNPRLWLTITIPMYVYTVLGLVDFETSYWSAGLAQQFLLLAMVLTAVAFVQTGTHPATAIIAQALATALLASRLALMASTIMLLTALYALGVRVRLRQILSSTIVVALIAVVISTARAAVGREQLVGDVIDRAQGIIRGSALLGTGEAATALIDDIVYRFDGNSFPSLIHEQYEVGYQPAGVAPIVNDVWVAIPSFLNPVKRDAAETERNDGAFVIDWFGLPAAIPFIPTQLGILYACLGPVTLPFLLAVAGVACERLDRRLHRIRTVDGLVWKIALCQANAFMEQGLIVYPLVLRGALGVIVLVSITKLLLRVAHDVISAQAERA